MQIRLLVPRAGIGFSQRPGDIIDVPDDEAVRMIKADQAEPVREGRAPEKATKRKSAEKARK